MENFEEKAHLCALNRIFGFEPRLGLALISHFGSASGIFQQDKDEIDRILGPYSKYKGKITTSAADQAADELHSLSLRGITFEGITESTYPPLLMDCEDAPIGLYIKTQTPVSDLWKPESISIVGTRDISLYGRDWCRRIVQGLSRTESRPSIISGLALGVDIEAHRTAIEEGLPTIAIMATGPDSIYPYRHRSFAEKIASTPGCALVTDYPPGTAPLAIHFLRRNRIIAGLGKATILVESKSKGGGMMTCRLAFSYNREIYALPGRADDICSQGCNELIREKIAEPITSISSLTMSLGLNSYARNDNSHCKKLISRYSERLPETDINIITNIFATGLQRTGYNYRRNFHPHRYTICKSLRTDRYSRNRRISVHRPPSEM